jgi:hypothetical protein
MPTFPPVLTPLPPRSPLRAAITAASRRPEPELVPVLLEQARLAPSDAAAATARAGPHGRAARPRARRRADRAGAGRSPWPFVDAATRGLLLTGRLVATHSDAGLAARCAARSDAAANR